MRKTFIALAVIFAAVASVSPASARSQSVFAGAWESIDSDGSYQIMAISGRADGVLVQYVDRYASVCVRHGGGPLATIQGRGTIDGNTLNVSFESVRCGGGLVLETAGGAWTITYDPGTDTFFIDPEQWGGALIIWERIRGGS